MKNSASLQTTLGLPPLPSHSSETITALLWARELLQQHITTVYAVQDPKGIEELKPIKIGGVDQWLHIRGRNRSNPVLLVLHGGPGSPNIGYLDAIQRPWEDYFTVVQWDQRQTGKSYYSADDEIAPLTVKQFISDTEEVIQYLCEYLEKEKLFIMGCSWGSVLGMHMVKRHPDWLHGYIGVGQVVNMMDNERTLYERLLSHAIEQQEAELITKLEEIAPYPPAEDPAASFVEHCGFMQEELSRLASEVAMRHLSIDDIGMFARLDQSISPHLTLTDLSNRILGDKPAVSRLPYHFTKEYMTTDLPNEIGSSFEVPIFFFSGTHDWQTPTVLSDKWFHKIDAPYKELIHFEESAHYIVNEEPGKILISLVNKVLPCANNQPKVS